MKKLKVWMGISLMALLLISLIPLNDAQAAILDKPQIAAGSLYTIGLRQDGTVVGTGYNSDGQRNVGDWSSIIYVAAGTIHTVGVKSDGRVVATGNNHDGQCNVGGWSDIVQVAVGYEHTVGLKSNGTVVAVGGDNTYGERDVGGWSNIVQIAADDYWSQGQIVSSHTIGVKKDGTVVTAGNGPHGQLDVSGWSDIVQVATGGHHTVGLKSDGTVVAVGDSGHNKLNVSGWSDIVQVAAGDFHTIGVKSNGRVLAVGWNGNGQRNVGGWRNIIQVDGGRMHTVGVKADGTAVATGLNRYGQCNVGSWDLTSAYEQGYQNGYQAGYNVGYQEGREDGYQSGYQAALLSTDINAVGYRLGDPPPSYDGSIRELNLDIEFENKGCGDAFNAYAYVSDWPSNVTVTQSWVIIGDIPAGSSTWSRSDYPITIMVDTSITPDPSESFVWEVEYLDANYNDRYIGNVIQFIDLTPPQVNAGSDQVVNLGDTVSVNAEFSDPGSLDTHTAIIYWDDASSEAGTLTEPNGGTGVVTGNHIYVWPDTYEISVEVTDVINTGSDVLIVEVLPVPKVMVEILIDSVDATEVPEATKNSLNASLDTARKVLSDSNQKNDGAAINALEAFINDLEAQRGKKIPVEVADELISKAQEIIAAISGGI